MRHLICIAACLWGCTSGNGLSSTDLAGADLAPRPGDLAGADLAAAPGALCAGTAVAGTCVQAFFAQVASCFAPSGACRQQSPAVARAPIWCWQNGDELDQMTGVDTSMRTYKSGGTTCLSESSGNIAFSTFTANGQTLRLNPSSGAFTCPDGTTTGSIGANFGGCAALQALVNPDTSMCPAGTCPF